ncbi:DUF1801 domain-containing protein [Patescibacteria group bacterium]|nr:DUF1801 domain-containing protein [Patescibacteria group bacterium]
MNMFKPTKAQTRAEYIASIPEPRKTDIKKLDAFIKKTLPSMKPFFLYNMLAYGPFHYKSKSGREGEWAYIGLASQKNYISLYVCVVDVKTYLAEEYKKELPKANIGKSCIRFKKLEDVDIKVLGKILKKANTLIKTGKNKFGV